LQERVAAVQDTREVQLLVEPETPPELVDYRLAGSEAATTVDMQEYDSSPDVIEEEIEEDLSEEALGQLLRRWL